MHCGLSWMFLLVPIPEFLSAMPSLLPVPGINITTWRHINWTQRGKPKNKT
jgi:hypothetical protein